VLHAVCSKAEQGTKAIPPSRRFVVKYPALAYQRFHMQACEKEIAFEPRTVHLLHHLQALLQRTRHALVGDAHRLLRIVDSDKPTKHQNTVRARNLSLTQRFRLW